MLYYIIHLGCQMNISDSERIREVLDSSNLNETDDEEQAIVLGIVACSVRQKAIDKVYSKIAKWNKWKNKRSIITFLTGCVLDIDKAKFLKLFDFVFPVEQIKNFPKILGEYGVVGPYSQGAANIQSFWKINPRYLSSYQAYIPIQNGCDKFCSYCAVPYTRGREVSREAPEVLLELKSLINSNYKIVTLLGQNVNSYGNDSPGEYPCFAELLKMCGELGKEENARFWLYYTSPHPGDMTTDVLEQMAAYQNIADWVHLPLQSGDDEILSRMNRKHNMADYDLIVKNIRSILPKAALFTDIIVGFPGETDSQFQNTRQALKRYNFNMAYIAIYSPRPGARSSKWEDDIPMEIKKERLNILSHDLQEMSLSLNNKLIGSEQIVLVEGPDRKKGYLSSRNEGKIIFRFKGNEDLIGKFVRIKTTSAAALSLEGDFVSLAD